MADNRLAGETSPYLLQHAENPVHWRPWGPDALEEAAETDRPILLSVGYAACHWCHVMAHESFENPAIAEQMNALFVNIKVDREERPDIDTIYQSALAMLGQQGGWPLTMFLTPDGKPFWGGTYFPPEARYGRAGFTQVLQAIAAAYREDKATITQNVDALTGGLAQLSAGAPGPGITDQTLTRASDALLEAADPIHGGLSGAPKFPQPPVFDFLLSEGARRTDTRFTQCTESTVRHMAQGGIYDHLGGGFARYSTDDVWLAPHFEKMAYDNAGLITLMTQLYRQTREPLLERRIAETVAWVQRDLQQPGGGFASSWDADSEGVEGKYYVWTAEEIGQVLGPDADLFRAAYDVQPEGNWEGTSILNRSHVRQDQEEDDSALAPLRQKLKTFRDQRVPPALDDKILADWNGLLIIALTEAAMAFGRQDWLDSALAAYHFVRQNLTLGEGRLAHAWRAGKAAHPAILDDYANMAMAALTLFEATGDQERIGETKAWVAIADRFYADPERGGYYLTASDAPALIVRSKTALDNPTPSGNGMLLGVAAKLYALTGDETYREKADGILRAFSGQIDRQFWALSTLLANSGFLQRPQQIVLIADPSDPKTRTLRDIAVKTYRPTRILCPIAPGASLEPGHPAAGKQMVNNKPTVYVCFGQTCLAPVTEPADLAAQLESQP